MDKIDELEELEKEIVSLLVSMGIAKPNDRSGIDRRFAVLITEQEKVLAWFQTFIKQEEVK